MIPLDLRNQNAMLATPCPDPAGFVAHPPPGDWVYDVKWDGVRCLAYVDGGQVTLRGRSGLSLTEKYPDLCERLAEIYPTGARVLDGEIICFDPSTGRPDFNRVQQRQAQSSAAAIAKRRVSHPATFMAFDLLWMDVDDLRCTALQARQMLLKVDAERWGSDPRLMSSQASSDGAAMWAFVNQHGLEGLIAKHRAAPYRGRRDSCWVKLKKTRRLTALVTGYEEGEGARAGKVGALLVSLLDDEGRLVPIGKVGTGFKEADHGPLLDCLGRGEPFLVEVEYMTYEKAGLRFPVFKGVRTDLVSDDCTMTQLNA